MKKPIYQVYIRNDWPLPFVEPWAVGPTKVAMSPFRWDLILVTNLGDKYAWCYRADSLFKLGHSIDLYLSDPKNLQRFKNQAKKAEKANRDFIDKLSNINITQLTLPTLAGLLKAWYKTHQHFTSWFMPIDATDETLEADIRAALNKTGLQLSLHGIAALLTPDVPTYVQREHKDFCGLARKFGQNTHSPAAQKAITEHERKWWWTVMGWGQHKPLSARVIQTNLAKVKNIKGMIGKQEYEERIRNQTIKLKRKLVRNLPQDVKNLLAAFEVLA